MLFAGFSYPRPVSPEIYQQRLASWRVKWESEAQERRSRKEQEAIGIRDRASALAQRNLTQFLTQIFVDDPGSDEVVALRVLQAMEGVASDPKIRQLLPGETISLLNNLHDWLLPYNVNQEGAKDLLE